MVFILWMKNCNFCATFQKFQSHCGTGYRCPIKMKLWQSHFLANWLLLWGSASTAKIQRVVYFNHLISIIHFSSKLVKIAYLWPPMLNRFQSEIFRRTHSFRVISENMKKVENIRSFETLKNLSPVRNRRKLI